MDLLKTDSIKRLLENLNISSSVNLHGVIFANEVETGSSLLSQLSVPLRESAEVPQENTAPIDAGASVVDPCDESGEEAHSSVLLPEVEELNALIQEEPTLQRALALESKALKTRGTFIPLMKYEILPSQDQEADQQGGSEPNHHESKSKHHLDGSHVETGRGVAALAMT
jgi:hypothetical protein